MTFVDMVVGDSIMAIRDCRVIAIEGAHGTGKSTLAQALTASFKGDHCHATVLMEGARTSPFVEELVLHGKGICDIATELHLFGTHIAQEQIMARHHEVLISDRTLASIIGYARLLLDVSQSDYSLQVLNGMEEFARSYCKHYDAIFFVSDLYSLERTNDPFRPKDQAFQASANEAIRQCCTDLELKIIDVPKGLTVPERVLWVRSHFHLSIGGETR